MQVIIINVNIIIIIFVEIFKYSLLHFFNGILPSVNQVTVMSVTTIMFRYFLPDALPRSLVKFLQRIILNGWVTRPTVKPPLAGDGGGARIHSRRTFSYLGCNVLVDIETVNKYQPLC